ncbi:DNA repair endonuclease XPF isoform X2 [Nematostella vectensis]|nr:DNA repair endonuclease XPF isoform X2 [Nematostella vectensis]
MYCDPAALVIVVNSSKYEEDRIVEELKSEGVMLPKVITTEYSSSERESIYLGGGVLFVTSRILVVDMLTKRIPVHLVSGMLVLKAHKIIESCQEAFILRLYRENNKTGFIKAFSDQPTAFMSGYCKVERVMKNLFVRKLSLWPRFHAGVSALLERHKPDVVELHLQMTSLMLANQTALLDLIDTSLRELRRANPSLDADELSVENCIIKSFDKALRVLLDPVWHQLGVKTKQLVADLKVLRLILFYLTQYDCVTFYKFLESLRASEREVTRKSLWLFMDATDSLFVNAKERVYGTSNNKPKAKKMKKDKEPKMSKACDDEPLLEESPKWKLLADILKEIEEDNEKNKNLGPGHVLVAAYDERTCYQLKEFLCKGSRALLTRLLENMNKNTGKGGAGDNPSELPVPPPLTGDSESDHEPAVEPQPPAKTSSRSRRGKSRGGRETKGKADAKQKRIDQDLPGTSKEKPNKAKQNIDENDTHRNIILKLEGEVSEGAGSRVKLLSSPVIVIHPLTGCSDPYSLIHTLYEVEPKYVVLYDADIEFVRQLEVFKASRPGIPLRVYFMIYTGSVEEQKYLTTLRKEKEAFEKLIREKASMVTPEEQEGRSWAAMALSRDPSKATDAVNTRKAGGRQTESQAPRKVIVDMREFRSELPSLIHRRGIDIEPVTLEVGDYILSPDMCVERKSVGDLIGSLNNGRLYSQAVAMTRYYKRPILLIEFDPNKSFSLQARTSLSGEISIQNVTSKLTLLTIHFPKLRILWCHSPYATAELFDELKMNHPEPDSTVAVNVGTDSSTAADLKYSVGPQDFILKLPGINSKNYRFVMNQTKDIQQLCNLSEAELAKLLGNNISAKALWEFLHTDKRGDGALRKPGTKSRK